MGILADAVNNLPELNMHAPGFSATGISPCPVATYYNYFNLNPKDRSKARRVMEDGHEQEDSIVRQLKRAGFKLRFTGKDQLEVKVGKAEVPGHPDGLITVPTYKEGMLEVKAMNLLRYSYTKNKGIEPHVKCQTQLYMYALPSIGIDVDFTWLYTKSRETCSPNDIIEEKDLTYSLPIVQATDEIILGGWKPKPVVCETCTTCRHTDFCWELPILDLSDSSDFQEDMDLVSMFLHAKMQKARWEEYYDLTKEELKKKLDEKDNSAVVAGSKAVLEVKRIPGERSNFDIDKFVELYGTENLHLILKKNKYESVRVRELKDYYSFE